VKLFISVNLQQLLPKIVIAKGHILTPITKQIKLIMKDRNTFHTAMCKIYYLTAPV